MKRIISQPFCVILSLSYLFSSHVFASAFQLWEQDGASVGNYHAGYAALGQDASIAFYNPAGMALLKRQQVVLGGAFVSPTFRYQGALRVANQLPAPAGEQGIDYIGIKAEGGDRAIIPALHYVFPLNPQYTFGVSAIVPFGLQTNYSLHTPLRYAATLSSIKVIDIAPSLAYALNDKASLGIGLDIQHAEAQLNAVGTAVLIPGLEAESINKATGRALGYRLGGLYQFTHNTRAGLSYHSKVKHELNGSSRFQGPLADAINDDNALVAHNAKTQVTLPAYTALSVFHQLKPRLAVMGSAIYTEWHVLKNLRLENIAAAIEGPDISEPIEASTTVVATIPQHYRNTWNLSVGSDYLLTEHLTLKAGLGFDQSPARRAYRNVQLPDNDRFIVAIGGHITATKTLSIDLGWSHFMMHKAHIAPPPQVVGAQTVTTNGYVRGSADVVGAQIVWNLV